MFFIGLVSLLVYLADTGYMMQPQLQVGRLEVNDDWLRVSGEVLSLLDLAGARLVWGDGLTRLESLATSIYPVNEMRWSMLSHAGSALLADGRAAVLLFSDFKGPCVDILGLSLGFDEQTKAGSGVAQDVTRELGRRLGLLVNRGSVSILPGDLGWLINR